MWNIWLIAAGIFLIIEAFTVGFLIFWLSIGSLLAMVVSFFTDNLVIQTTTFVVSSCILIFATKPFVNKVTQNIKTTKTNVYSLVGKIGIVTKEIDSIDSVGQVKVGAETWSAISDNEDTIPEGTKVKVLEVKGVKAVVEPI